ncbi:hypothetical protein TMatcc_006165 [Talaromyces marneffei ATCC 18224]
MDTRLEWKTVQRIACTYFPRCDIAIYRTPILTYDLFRAEMSRQARKEGSPEGAGSSETAISRRTNRKKQAQFMTGKDGLRFPMLASGFLGQYDKIILPVHVKILLLSKSRYIKKGREFYLSDG